MGKYVLGMDIGGTNIRIAMSYEKGTAVKYQKVPRVSVLTGDEPMKNLADFIEGYIHENGEGVRPSAVVIGFPATVDATRRVVLQAPNIPAMEGVSYQGMAGHNGMMTAVFELVAGKYQFAYQALFL